MSKYRFKTKEEFIRDGLWGYAYSSPLGWDICGNMNRFLGSDIPESLNKECDEGSGLMVDGWRFAPTDYTIKEESKNWATWVPKKEINANGFEYFGDTLMEVSHDKKTWETRVVFGKKNGLYAAWAGADSIKNAKHEANSVGWKYARRIKTKLTIQEIADKFGLDVNEIEII